MAHRHPLTARVARAFARRSQRKVAAPRQDPTQSAEAPRTLRAIESLLIGLALSVYVAALLAGGYVVLLALQGH